MSSRRSLLAACALFLVLSLVFCRRFFDLTDLESHCMTDGDPGLNAWVLDWGTHALTTRGVSMLDGNAFFPYSKSIALVEHMTSLAVLNVFLKPFGSTPWFGYNVLVFLSYFLSGVGGFLFARDLTGSARAGVWGGLFWAFTFFRVHHMSHLQILSFEWMPFCVLYLRRGLREASLKNWGAFTVFFLLQSLVSWYLAVITAFLVVIVGLFALEKSVFERRTLAMLAGSIAISGAAILPVAHAYSVAAAHSTLVDRMATAMTSGDLVHLRDYLYPPAATWIGSQVWLNPYSVWGENTLYIGYTAIVLALAGSIPERRSRRSIGLGLALIVIGFWLSKGFVSNELHARLPLYWLARIFPFLAGLRAAQRFSLLVYFGVLILSSLAIARTERLGARYLPTALLAACSVIFLAEVFPVLLPYDGFRRHHFEYSRIDREIERIQRELGRHVAAIHFPIYHFVDAKPDHESPYLVGSTLHYASLVNGFASAAPLGWVEDVTIDNRLPEPTAVARLVERGVDLVCLHPALPAERRRDIEEQLVARGQATLLFSDDEGDVILQLRR